MRTAIPVVAATAAIILGGAAAIELMPTSYEVGVAAYSRGDYPKAARQFQTAAANGQAESQFMMGRLYAMGLGLPQDLVQAYAWHSRAAAQGHGGAGAALANLRGILTPEALARAQSLSVTAHAGGAVTAGGMLETPQRRPISESRAEIPMGKPVDVVDITRVQARLAELGYFSGAADGLYNADLANAIFAYQRQNGLQLSEELTPELMVSLKLQPSANRARQTASAVPAASRPSLDRNTVVALQRHLALLGYETGPADGILGPRTRGAIEAWQKAQGLKNDGQASPEIASAILKTPAQKINVTMEAAVSPAEEKAKNATSATPDPWPVPDRVRTTKGSVETPATVAPEPKAEKETPTTALAAIQNGNMAAKAADSEFTARISPSEIRGTPTANPADAPALTPPPPPLNSGLSKDTGNSGVTALQRELSYRGYLGGRPSGTLDDTTRGAIKNYQRDAGLAVTGEPSPGLLDHLRYSAPQLVQDEARSAR